MSGIGLVDALVQIISSGKQRERQNESVLALCEKGMPASLRTLVQALVRFDVPLHLSFNHWELGVLDDAQARKMVAQAGGSKKVDKHERVIVLAIETGGLILVAGCPRSE